MHQLTDLDQTWVEAIFWQRNVFGTKFKGEVA